MDMEKREGYTLCVVLNMYYRGGPKVMLAVLGIPRPLLRPPVAATFDAAERYEMMEKGPGE